MSSRTGKKTGTSRCSSQSAECMCLQVVSALKFSININLDSSPPLSAREASSIEALAHDVHNERCPAREWMGAKPIAAAVVVLLPEEASLVVRAQHRLEQVRPAHDTERVSKAKTCAAKEMLRYRSSE